MKAKLFLILTLAATLTSPSHAASYLQNGNLESWNGVSGTPPTGTLSSWWNPVGFSPVQSAGLVAGSNYAATIAGSSQLAQTPTTLTNSFSLSLSFAATYATVAGSNNLGMRFDIYNADASAIIQSIVLTDGAGGLTLTVRDGSTGNWQPIVTGLTASTYNAAMGTWTTPTVYDLTLTTNWATGLSTISLGLNGGTQTNYAANYFYSSASTAAATTFGRLLIRDVATTGSAAFVVDNLAINSVPEPNTLALFFASVLLLGCLSRRRALACARH